MILFWILFLSSRDFIGLYRWHVTILGLRKVSSRAMTSNKWKLTNLFNRIKDEIPAKGKILHNHHWKRNETTQSVHVVDSTNSFQLILQFLYDLLFETLSINDDWRVDWARAVFFCLFMDSKYHLYRATFDNVHAFNWFSKHFFPEKKLLKFMLNVVIGDMCPIH